MPSGLTNVVAITAGGGHNLALKADGTAVGWGDDSSGESDVPLGLSNVVAIAAGNAHSLALKADGTLVAWGAGTVFDPSSGVDYGQSLVPADLVNVAAIAGGMFQSLALRADGPPFLTSLLAKRTVVHGSTTWLRISATGAEPLSYQWRFNGTNLPGATNAVLELDNVQFNQAGTYSVVVSNGFGTATSPDTELDVAPFFITAQPQSQA